MAILRDHPYAAFNFLVAMEGTDPGSVQAGFMEISGLDRRIEVLAYRAGNDRALAPRLYTGLARPATVLLRRGLIGALDLQQWLQTALDGRPERRTVVVELQDEARENVTQRWVLRGALPVAVLGPRLNAIESALAVETLELAVEAIAVE